jgi:hypothetical protein
MYGSRLQDTATAVSPPGKNIGAESGFVVHRRGIGRSSEDPTRGAVRLARPMGYRAVCGMGAYASICEQSRRTTGKLGCIGPAYCYAIGGTAQLALLQRYRLMQVKTAWTSLTVLINQSAPCLNYERELTPSDSAPSQLGEVQRVGTGAERRSAYGPGVFRNPANHYQSLSNLLARIQVQTLRVHSSAQSSPFSLSGSESTAPRVVFR